MTINANLSATNAELDKAGAGIRKPTIVNLLAGTVLFRFASTTDMRTGANIPSDQWACGAWWFQEHDYRKIIDRYKEGKLSLGTVARTAGAVQPSWSNMDVSIKAVLMDDFNVYIGKGLTQYNDQLPNGMTMTLKGWSDVDQIYIPDMRGAARRALRVLRQKIITTDNFGFT